MKAHLSILLAITCLTSRAHAAVETPAPDSVVVAVIHKPLPRQEAKRAKFLWDSFANKPDEEKFSSYGTEKWEDNFARFAKSLVEKAEGHKLDSASLRKVLDLVLTDAQNSKDRIAYLPVGAYQTTLDGKTIWIVTVKWEYPSMGEGVKLGHIRVFAFDQKSLKQVAFTTCG